MARRHGLAFHHAVDVVEVRRERQSERERQDDRGDRDRGGRSATAADHAEVEVPADREHEQHQPELPDQREHVPRAGGEKIARRVAGERSEQRRAEDDASGDLADTAG